MGLIFLGFILAYNPIYLYYLMSHGALGGITLRTLASGIFLAGLFFLSFLSLLITRNGKIRVRSTAVFLLVNLLFFFYACALIVGFIKGNDPKYMILDSFPLLEMFVVYYFIKFSAVQINFKKTVKWLVFYLFLMAITDLFSYGVLSFFKGAYFGALRALIGGTTVNRLMDYVLPLFLPMFMLVYTHLYRRKWVVVLLGVSGLVIILTFYRTVYTAVFLGLFYLIISNRKQFFFISRTLLLIILVGGIVLGGGNLFFKNSRFNFPELFSQRVASIFSPDKKIDYSAASRVAQNKDMVYNALNSFPNISGMGGSYRSAEGQITPVYCTANFFLQLILLLGIPAGLLFLWLYLKAFFSTRKLALQAADQSEQVFFSASSALLIILAVVLCLFPYVSYFPLLYIFGWILGCVDKRSEEIRVRV